MTSYVSRSLLAVVRYSTNSLPTRQQWYRYCNKKHKLLVKTTACMSTQSAPSTSLNHDARTIFDSAVSSVLPHNMVKNTLKLSGNTLCVADKEYRLNRGVYIVAFGKAVLGMVRSVEDILGERIVAGVASVPAGMPELLRKLNKSDLLPSASCRVQIVEGSPDNIPDHNAYQTSKMIEQLLNNLKEDDLVLTFITGGGSALLPYPEPPITLDEMTLVTKLLSRRGATIQQLNTVRKHLELLKGGGIVKAAFPAQVATLILSDVVGDDMNFIASGPTVPNVSSPSQSISLIEDLGLADQMPQSVMEVLQSRNMSYEAIQHDDPGTWFPYDKVQNVLVGTNTIALEGARDMAEHLGYIPVILTASLCGDVREVSVIFAKILRFILALMYRLKPTDGSERARANAQMELELVTMGVRKKQINEIRSVIRTSRNSNKPLCILTGGETTVQVKGEGLGGRNQEMALLVAMEMRDLVESEHVDCSPVFLSAGTDGQDGPTAAAGAVIDAHTIIDAIAQDLSPHKYLADNDSYNFFRSVSDGSYHIITGLTGTNVMDIQILLLKPNRVD